MARVVDHPISDQSSDSEEINKLFPKCRPRVPNSVNDVNQNSVMKEDKQVLTSSSQAELNALDRANDNIMTSHDCDYHQSPSSDLEQNDSPLSEKEEKVYVNRVGENAEDQSVVSAYDRYGYEHFIFPAVREEHCTDEKGDFCREIVYDDDLDVGFHVNHRSEHTCESRIEIAGGREIFSASRSRPSKKRHSDEVVYHPPQNYDGMISKDHKRHSGEVLYDDRLKRFMYHVHASPVGKKPHSVERISHATQTCEGVTARDDNHYISDHHNSSFRARKMSQPKLPQNVEEPLEHTLASGHVVYETPVHNAEVIYDDIGDLICQQKPDQSSILQVKPVIKCEEVPCSEVSDNHEEYFEEKCDESQVNNSSQTFSHNSDKAMLLSYTNNNIKSNEVSYCNDESPGNFSPEEVMDTESEPSSPTKLGIARVIGNVPIAQYEGSPRRYGPRPGYPQRIVSGDHQQKESPTNTVCDDAGSVTADSSVKCSINSSKSHETDTTLQGMSLKQIKETFQSPSDKHPDKIGSDGCCGSDTSRGQADCQQDENEDSKSPSLEPDFSELEYKLYRVNSGSSYVGKRLAQSSCGDSQDSPKRSEKVVNGRDGSNHGCERVSPDRPLSSEISAYIPNEHELMLLHERVHQHTLHVEMAEQDRESLSTYPGTEDLGETEVGEQVDNTRNFTLSPETTDCDSNEVESEVSLEGSLNSGGQLLNSMPVLEDGLSSGQSSDAEELDGNRSSTEDGENGGSWHHSESRNRNAENKTMMLMKQQISEIEQEIARRSQKLHSSRTKYQDVEEFLRQQDCHVEHSPLQDIDISYFDTLRHDSNHNIGKVTNYSKHSSDNSLPEIENSKKESVTEAIREIKQAIRRSKGLQLKTVPNEKTEAECQPIWVPRLSQTNKGTRTDGTKDGQTETGLEEECDTDQETDRLLGAQRNDDRGFFDEKNPAAGKKKNTSREVLIHEPEVLIEGVLFRARYLGSTQLVCEGQPTKATRMMQAEEAVSRIKSLAPEGETQPSPEVDLFISTEKIMVLNTDLKEIMMDHALRTISYIADIGDLVVLMARRRVLNSPEDPTEPKIKRTPKMICHVFESEEAQFIAQSIGQAFQVAYMEFLKANGIEDSSFLKEMDYREVLNSQEIFGNELEMFAKKEKQKEVIVPKAKGEILGMVIVESGWGSMLPTVVIANMAQNGPAARCAQLNIGDQIIAINGISLVGLPLSTCQDYIKNTRNQTVVKLTVVPCTPVVEVKIKRPDTKYQLGFSVQNGVICSLLRGGIAERGGVRVGHRIIEINGQSVVAVPHEKIVNLLATSVGEIHMKTMPTSMFRLLTGQETPVYI